MDFWLIALMLYAFVASSLPVWLLLQPRDLINSHQLVVGLFALFLGFFLSKPEFHAPAIGPLDQLPVLVPLLFVTVACGAISGFHGLVSSGTTSKQLAHVSDARPVGYGAMLAEGSLAILATLAVATGMMVGGADHVWHAVYEPIIAAKTLPGVPQALTGFVNGAANMLVALGLSGGVASTVVAVLVISFAATSLDTALRIQRLIIAELGDIFHIEPLKNRWLGGAIAAGSVVVLIYADKAHGAKSLWPVFGATNQVLAAITLLLCALYLRRMQRAAWPYLAPALFVMPITFGAMGVQVFQDFAAGKYLVATVGGLIAVLTAWVALEGAFAWRRAGSPVAAVP